MLNDDLISAIRDKMKKTKTYSATFGRELGISRQAVNFVLNQKCPSKRVEEYLIRWLDDKNNKQ